MVKQLFLPLAAVAIFIVLVGLFTQKPSFLNLSKYLQSSNSVQKKTMTVGSKTIQVEIANTQDLRTKGLSGRTSLPADSGMLFVFDLKGETPVFWMKDMLIPLDMIWIHSSSGDVSDEKIVKIDKNIPAPPKNTSDDKLDKIRANQPVDYVLEVNGGFSDQNNIKVGDFVTPPTL